MYDFLTVKKEFSPKAQRWTYTPAFIIRRVIKDLMVRSRDFYALYDPETGMWITDENEAIEKIDRQVYDYVLKDVGQQIMDDPEHGPIVKRIADTDNHLIDKFHKFCQKDLRDSYKLINQKVKFSNSEIKREDYCTFKLPYPLVEGATPYYDKLVNTLYLPEEKNKFEWLVGALIAGDQTKIQKFFVFYGEPGSGKSTIINKIIAETVFGGDDAPYAHSFKAEMLVNRDQFGTEFLTFDPIIAYDNEAELSRVDTCTIINTIVAHESTRVNSKYGRAFTVKPNCFLICGSNEVVQLSPKSGFNRRLIDIRQTGEHLPTDEYDECIEQLQFEKSGIAAHCLSVYKKCGKNYYNHYVPEDMLLSTSPFHNFVKDNYFELKDGITLSNAYHIYTSYCTECNFKNILVKYKFRDLLKLYFNEFGEKEDDKSISQWFSGFKAEKIGLKKVEPLTEEKKEEEKKTGWLEFNFTKSDFDEVYGDQPAQYAKEDGSPIAAWDNVKTTLADLDTHKTHYILLPGDVITVDFDLKDENGNKSLERNIEAANKFPPTYAELSNSGQGIHLNYIWTGGNPDDLSRVVSENIEVKVSKGKSALRRRLTKCNDLPIAELSSGLPLKEGGKSLVDQEAFKNEAKLRAQIIRAMLKPEEGGYKNLVSHKTAIDFIDHLLKEARMSGKDYDVSDLYDNVYDYATQSSHRAEYCTNLVDNMFFKSKSVEEKIEKENIESEELKEAPIVFFDVESYPEDKEKNMKALFVVCYKLQGPDKPVIKLINPSPKEIRELIAPGRFRLIGFNNRDYDNHMLYGRAQGFSAAELNRRSRIMIESESSEEKNSVKFREAWNLSYTDVLDFASATHKQSLKKWEIELGITHMEMGIPWNQAAPEDRWDDIADYCANDVLATEAVFNHIYSDFIARQILADISGLTVNDKTNSHTAAILTNGIKDPKSQYVYTKLGEMKWPDGSLIFPGYEFNANGIDKSRYKPGVKIIKGKSIYKGLDPGEGGRKIGYPGIYQNIALLDVQSEHPHSAIKLNIFGDVITKRFEALVEGRVAIKHGEYEKAADMLSVLGRDISKYFKGSEEEIAQNTAGLADALKTAINACYGLTSASFDNKLRDPRNIDNIVAKYGALFMINLEEDVRKQGYVVSHCSTDSIKVADADQKIIDYISEYGKRYGFTFEFEAFYSKMALTNEAVYVAKYATEKECMNRFGFVPSDNKKAIKKNPNMLYTVTGKQFAVPYVFKTLFSHEEIVFEDVCETFSVKEGALYLDMNETFEDVSELEERSEKLSQLYSSLKVYKSGSIRSDNLDKDIARITRQIEKNELYLQESVGLPSSVKNQELLLKAKEKIEKCHNYIFIGRVGQFTPIKEGYEAGILYRIKGDVRAAVAGTKKFGSNGAYRWFESDSIRGKEWREMFDRSYYTKLVDDAVETISQYGDFEWFVSDEPVAGFMPDPIPLDANEWVPFDERR